MTIEVKYHQQSNLKSLFVNGVLFPAQTMEDAKQDEKYIWINVHWDSRMPISQKVGPALQKIQNRLLELNEIQAETATSHRIVEIKLSKRPLYT